MRATLERERHAVRGRPDRCRSLGIGLMALGAGLVANSILGPLGFDAVRYPLSETMISQLLGLEAFSLAIVAPLSVLAGILALRGHRAASVLGFGPAAYTAYMFVQYIVGPEYAYYPGVMGLHLGLFVLAGVLAVGTWHTLRPDALPAASARSDRRRALVLFGLAAFLAFRYVPILADAVAGRPLEAEFLEDVSMFWSIVLLDVGIVLPATIAVGVGLLAEAGWAHKAMYVVIGWWALVPPSVAAMALAMIARDDPYANAGQAVVFVLGALVFAAFAVGLFRPLFFGRRSG